MRNGQGRLIFVDMIQAQWSYLADETYGNQGEANTGGDTPGPHW